MRKLLFCALLVLSACSDGARYAAPVTAVIEDAATKLVEVYPPAKTPLTLMASDDFGRDLTAKLREYGYAVSETNIRNGSLLRYMVATDMDGVLVALYYVGDELLGRGYTVNPTGDNYAPLGAWTLRKTEKGNVQ